MITPEKVSVEMLNDVLAAYMDTSFDEDGDLMVKGECQVYITIVPDKSSIRLMTIFRIRDESSLDARLEAVIYIIQDFFWTVIQRVFFDINHLRLRFRVFFMTAVREKLKNKDKSKKTSDALSAAWSPPGIFKARS